MKKLFLGIAAFSLLLGVSSCGNESVEKAGKDGKIAFKSALGKQTRASEFGNASWQDGAKMNVYAYSLASGVLVHEFNLTFDKTSVDPAPLAGDWTYFPAYYAPGYDLRYYAIYPTNAGTYPTNTDASTVTVDPDTAAADGTHFAFGYTVKADEDQEDLIGAATITWEDQVTLPFTHLLSQVNFALVDVPGLGIEIQNLKVNNVKDTSTYTYSYSTTPTPATVGNWAVPTAAAAGRVDNYVSYTGYTEGTPGTSYFKVPGVTGKIVYLGNGNGVGTYDNALMLMPQTFSVPADGNFSFEFKLTIPQADGSTRYFPDSADGSVWAPAVSQDFCGFDNKTWTQSKRYVYVIDFTDFMAGGRVIFTMDIADWTDADLEYAQTLEVSRDNAAGSIMAAIRTHGDANVANPGLAVFPITVNGDPTSTATIDDIDSDKFDQGDVIRIQFPTATGAGKVALSTDDINGVDLNTIWTLLATDNIVTLTKI